MASNSASTQSSSKKMEYKPVKFDVNEIAPDAPAGEWQATVPRGKSKIQPTKEDKFPMIILSVRLEKTDEEGEEFEKALGTELSTFLVFGSKTSRGDRMSKLRIREVCEAADVDLDLIPKVINHGDDLEPLLKALEGKKFTVWTVLKQRKDTGETNTELVFRDPKNSLRTAGARDDEDEGDDDDEPASERQPRGGSRKPAAKGKSRR